MRWEVVKELVLFLESSSLDPKNICIVGGSSSDPEVTVLEKHFPSASIFYAGIDNYGMEKNWIYLDLNSTQDLIQQFDLLVCSQVLEHVWNISNVMENLRLITKNNGVLWMNCPTSNIPHGSPDYYSAGYSPEFLVNNLQLSEFKCLLSKNIGSERYYKATHLLSLWSSEQEHRYPITGYRFTKPITKGKILEFLRRIPGRILMLSWDSQVTDEIKFATETIYAGIRIEN